MAAPVRLRVQGLGDLVDSASAGAARCIPVRCRHLHGRLQLARQPLTRGLKGLRAFDRRPEVGSIQRASHVAACGGVDEAHAHFAVLPVRASVARPVGPTINKGKGDPPTRPNDFSTRGSVRLEVALDQCGDFVRYDRPVDWNGKPAEFVIGIAAAGDDHLSLLSKVAETFVDDTRVAALRSATTTEDVLAVLDVVRICAEAEDGECTVTKDRPRQGEATSTPWDGGTGWGAPGCRAGRAADLTGNPACEVSPTARSVAVGTILLVGQYEAPSGFGISTKP